MARDDGTKGGLKLAATQNGASSPLRGAAPTSRRGCASDARERSIPKGIHKKIQTNTITFKIERRQTFHWYFYMILG